MLSFRLILATAVMVALGAHGASALEIQDNAAGKAAANFSDPDDNVPFPHVSDDGQPTANFGMQPVGQSGVSFSLTPNNSQPSAFERAQERQMQ